MINKEKVLENTIQRCRDNNMIIPTYAQMRNPELVPDKIRNKLSNIGLWDLNPLNLFRITWKNEPVKSGGGYGEVNHVVLPKSLTGVDAKTIPNILKVAAVAAAFCRYKLLECAAAVSARVPLSM